MLPALLAFGVFLFGMVLSGVGIWMRRGRTTLSFLQSHHDALGHYVAILTAMYGLLLALILLSLWEIQQEAETNTEVEAGLANSLQRLGSEFPESQSQEIRRQVLAYLQLVQRQEWPAMVIGDEEWFAREPPTLRQLWRSWMQVEPASQSEQALFEEAIQEFGALQAARIQRITHAKSGLPVYLWFLLILGAAALYFCMLFIGLEYVQSQVLLTSICGGWLLVLLFVVYDLQNPFRGYWVVSPEPYAQIERLIEDRTDQAPEATGDQSIGTGGSQQ